jgi:hypothetical protein
MESGNRGIGNFGRWDEINGFSLQKDTFWALFLVVQMTSTIWLILLSEFLEINLFPLARLVGWVALNRSPRAHNSNGKFLQ